VFVFVCVEWGKCRRLCGSRSSLVPTHTQIEGTMMGNKKSKGKACSQAGEEGMHKVKDINTTKGQGMCQSRWRIVHVC